MPTDEVSGVDERPVGGRVGRPTRSGSSQGGSLAIACGIGIRFASARRPRQHTLMPRNVRMIAEQQAYDERSTAGVSPRRCCLMVAVLVLLAALGAGCSSGNPDVAPPLHSSSTAASAPPGGAGTSGQPPTVTAPPPKPGSVRITAVELAPEDPHPGGQILLLANDTDRAVDMSCWTVNSASTGKSAWIIVKGPVAPGASLRLVPETALFESVDTLSLLDRQGQVVDRTPKLTDRTRDDQLWFRQSNGTWTFGRGFLLPRQIADARLVPEANC